MKVTERLYVQGLQLIRPVIASVPREEETDRQKTPRGINKVISKGDEGYIGNLTLDP